MPDKYTKEEMKIIDKYLKSCIKNNKKCQNCKLRHKDNTCYFSAGCFLDNQNFYLSMSEDEYYNDIEENEDDYYPEYIGDDV